MLEASRQRFCHDQESCKAMPDDNSNRPGEQAALSASPPVVTEGVEKSKPAAGRTSNQRLTAVGVAALVLTLLKLVFWLATPTRQAVYSFPPGINLPTDGRAAYLRGDKPTSGEVDRSLGKCGKLFPTGQGAVPGINCAK